MKKGRIEMGLAGFVLLIAIWNAGIAGIVAIAAFACLAFYRFRTDGEVSDGTVAPATPTGNPAQMEAKGKHFDEIRAYARGKESVTNDEIEALLGVSDATTERYLNELEEKGKLRQVGRTGRSVSYKLL